MHTRVMLSNAPMCGTSLGGFDLDSMVVNAGAGHPRAPGGGGFMPSAKHFVFEAQYGAGVGLTKDLIITRVDGGSPAEIHGCFKGCKITGVNGDLVGSVAGFRRALDRVGGYGTCVVEFVTPIDQAGSGGLGAAEARPNQPWDCSVCSFQNIQSAQKCSMCNAESFDGRSLEERTPSLTVLPPTAAFVPPPRAQLDTAQTEAWECSACSYHNMSGRTCDICDAAKSTQCRIVPSSSIAVVTPARLPLAPAVPASSVVPPPPAQAAMCEPWECSVCTFLNTSSESACDMCGGVKIKPGMDGAAARGPGDGEPPRPSTAPKPPPPPKDFCKIPWGSIELEKTPFARGANGQIFKGKYFANLIAAKQLILGSGQGTGRFSIVDGGIMSEKLAEFEQEVRKCCSCCFRTTILSVFSFSCGSKFNFVMAEQLFFLPTVVLRYVL